MVSHKARLHKIIFFFLTQPCPHSNKVENSLCADNSQKTFGNKHHIKSGRTQPSVLSVQGLCLHYNSHLFHELHNGHGRNEQHTVSHIRCLLLSADSESPDSSVPGGGGGLRKRKTRGGCETRASSPPLPHLFQLHSCQTGYSWNSDFIIPML